MRSDNVTTAGRIPRVATLRRESAVVRRTLIALALAVVGVVIVLPVVNVFYEALSQGAGTYWNNLLADRDTRHSILLTLTVAPLAVASNLAFGLAAAWTIARFRFPGRA